MSVTRRKINILLLGTSAFLIDFQVASSGKHEVLLPVVLPQRPYFKESWLDKHVKGPVSAGEIFLYIYRFSHAQKAFTTLLGDPQMEGALSMAQTPIVTAPSRESLLYPVDDVPVWEQRC